MQHSLFLGYPLSAEQQAALQHIPPARLDLFINRDPAYLQKKSHNGQLFLGKSLDKHVSLQEIDLLSLNIHSLLKAVLTPQYFVAKSCILFPS